VSPRWWIAGLTALAIAACGAALPPTPTAEPTASGPTRTPPPPATPIPTIRPVHEQAGLSLPVVQGELFAGSGVCAACHMNMADDSGADVSLDAAWRSTLMANSARDPYWQAVLRAEVVRQPEQRSEIEDLCATCHMPMARFTEAASGNPAAILDDGLLNPDHPLHVLAMDGVSCTLCHQIRPDNLGYVESYNGQFQIDTELDPGKRVIYGPYSAAQDLAEYMELGAGYVPVQGLHLAESELCGTCHTLFLANGGFEFPLQTTYFEWYYSDHRSSQSCQDCHMPEAVGGVRVASTSPFPRSPFAQHTFVGANSYMLQLMENQVEQLGLTASAEQFQISRLLTIDQLENRTAELEIEELRLSGERVTVELVVRNLAGHKFPSGFPAARAWIRLWVEDGQGELVFESGGYDSAGRILANDHDLDPAAFEPHYLSIVQADQVQIYEAVPRDAGGRLTTYLMESVAYAKDNRLLPAGMDTLHAPEAIQVRGRAAEDGDFLPGEDRIQYSFSLGTAAGPFTLGVELLYQPIGYRWVESLRGLEGEEVTRFLGLYEAVPNLPVVVARQTAELEG